MNSDPKYNYPNQWGYDSSLPIGYIKWEETDDERDDPEQETELDNEIENDAD